MVALLHQNVLDFGLNYAKTYADKIYLCRTQPTTYDDATTPAGPPGSGTAAALGVKNFGTGAVFPSEIYDAGIGRRLVSSPLTDGETLVAGSGAYWAVVYSLGGILIATNSLLTPLTLTVGQPWSLSAFGIQLDFPRE